MAEERTPSHGDITDMRLRVGHPYRAEPGLTSVVAGISLFPRVVPALLLLVRLTFVNDIAGRAIALANRRVVEDGPHEDLLASNRSYARMFANQASWYSKHDLRVSR